MKLILKNISLAAALYILSSCAFLMNGKNVDISINSNPSGANIIIEGRNYGRTPATLNLEPKNYNVVLSKEGYGSTEIKLETWQAIRRKEGEGSRCLADALGTLLILPMFSYWSVYCRDFKESEYSINIPYLGKSSAQQNIEAAPYSLQTTQPSYQNYYQPYGYGY